MRLSLLIIIFISFTLSSLGQSKEDKAKAYGIAKEAIIIMDYGDFDKSIEMLKKAEKLDPNNYTYPYEMAFAYYSQQKYKKTIKTLKKVIKSGNSSDQCYTLLGNSYDMVKQPEKAIEIYKSGLIKFPKSGRLYFELGNVLGGIQKHNEALDIWEKGVTIDPTYPSNYYIASIYFCEYTSEKIWGILYGELFQNIERGSKRTETMSKLIFDTYKSSLIIKSDTEAVVTFSKSNQISLPAEGKQMKLPFTMQYEMTMILALSTQLDKQELGIKSLNAIRTTFINNWYDSKKNIDYPNIVFDWHKKLIELDYFESYNYWLFMKGNEDEFNAWLADHKDKFDAFFDWFTENPLDIDEQHYFYRLQLDL